MGVYDLCSVERIAYKLPLLYDYDNYEYEHAVPSLHTQ